MGIKQLFITAVKCLGVFTEKLAISCCVDVGTFQRGGVFGGIEWTYSGRAFAPVICFKKRSFVFVFHTYYIQWRLNLYSHIILIIRNKICSTGLCVTWCGHYRGRACGAFIDFLVRLARRDRPGRCCQWSTAHFLSSHSEDIIIIIFRYTVLCVERAALRGPTLLVTQHERGNHCL